MSEALALMPAAKRWWEKRRLEQFISAWHDVPLPTLYDLVCRYYSEENVPLFAYPEANGLVKPVPLYSPDNWTDLSRETVVVTFEDVLPPFRPGKEQFQFWERYRDLKRLETGKDWPLHDNPIFRLTELQTMPAGVHLHFTLGTFADSVMCQYVLETEARVALHSGREDRAELSVRNAVARSPEMLDGFMKANVVRIGVNTLILLNQGNGAYCPLVYRRSKLTMAQDRLFDCVSSCIFEVSTHAKQDLEWTHTVLREIYEELFGNPDIVFRSQMVDPFFFYEEPGIRELVSYLEGGAAVFDVTGFCIDLVRLVPEIACVLVVTDPEYFATYRQKFRLGSEFHPGRAYVVPGRLKDVEAFWAEDLPTSPEDHPLTRGVNPGMWTLPGAFSFYQGLRRFASLDVG